MSETQSPLINWLFDPSKSAEVGGWGLVLTIVGFGFTAFQLLRTHGAVRASERATAALRERLAAAGTAHHVNSLQPLVRAAKRELDLKLWKVAVDELHAIRNVLLVLYDRTEHIDFSLRQSLAPFASDIMGYTKYLSSPGKGGVKNDKVNEIRNRLGELDGLSMKLADHLTEKTP